MDKIDKKTEELLKNMTKDAKPSRLIFSEMMGRVTNDSENRNTLYKGHYKLINLFMKKGVLIGIPVALVAVLLFVSINKPKTNTGVAIVDSNNQQVNYPNDPSLGKTEDVDKSSFDQMLAILDASADREAINANNESEEEVYVNSKVDTFNSLKNTQYENNI